MKHIHNEADLTAKLTSYVAALGKKEGRINVKKTEGGFSIEDVMLPEKSFYGKPVPTKMYPVKAGDFTIHINGNAGEPTLNKNNVNISAKVRIAPSDSWQVVMGKAPDEVSKRIIQAMKERIRDVKMPVKKQGQDLRER